MRGSDGEVQKVAEHKYSATWSLSYSVTFEKKLVLGVNDGFVHSIPAGGGDTPVVGGVLVAVDADLSSLHFFVSINTHGVYYFIVYILDNQFVIAFPRHRNVLQRYNLFSFWQNFFLWRG